MTSRQRLQSEGFFTLKANPGEGLCPVRGCRKKGHKNKMGLCHAHHQYRWRMLSPKRSAYTTLRDHAKARGLEFTVSVDYLNGLMDAYAYFDHAAESRGEFPSLDRIDSTKGYCQGNLRVVTVSQNVIRNNRERHLPSYVQSILDRKRARAKENPCLAGEVESDESDCPF